MAARLSSYLDLLYQDLIRSRQLGGRRGQRRLPPVVPMVLYNGRRRWTAPTELAYLIEPGPAGLDAYRPRLRYLLIDENAYRDSELATMRNLAAALFRLENSRDPEPVRAVLIALAEWLKAPEQFELRHSFVVWLRGNRSDPLSPTLPRKGGGSKRISGLSYRTQPMQSGGLNGYVARSLFENPPAGHPLS